MSDYPPEVEAFHTALRRLAGVMEVDTGLKELGQFGPEVFWRSRLTFELKGRPNRAPIPEGMGHPSVHLRCDRQLEHGDANAVCARCGAKPQAGGDGA